MVAIKGLEMPKSCHECDAFGISDLTNLDCPCDHDDVYSFNDRPDGCPLIELEEVD